MGGSCASQNADAKVLPVYLAFAFDVSGSMGEGDKPWHDRMLKWDPVVRATKGFFEDQASSGLNASLTFFPDSSNKCSDSSYTSPDVPWTPLPSAAFGMELDEIGSQSWRGGTPTLHVVRGTISSVQQSMQQTPGRYAIVLVTDGYPQGCSDNAISSVVNAVAEVKNTIPTYVVGVRNPPIDGAPDTVTDLQAIAVAGGTEVAYLIDTGDPSVTTAKFKATIDKIRGSAISCNVNIPPPPDGKTFDKQNVAVTYRSGDNKTPLSYDANCTMPNSWHYDNPASPKQILLCDSTCTTIQADASATLNFEFTCEPRVTVPL
ncbi:MAG: vWA domain-containing protein [Myxococcota bacterium]